MSPVRPNRQRDVRALALAVGGVVLALVLVGLFVWGLPKLSESGTVEVKLGAETFDAGRAEFRAPSVDADGPFLFSDVAGGQRDIYVQHVGPDPLVGWSAFDARVPGSPRTCTLRWDNDRKQFTDPCTGATVPADGGPLPRYPVTIDADGHIIVDLKPGAGSTSTTTTTSAGLVTGGSLR